MNRDEKGNNITNTSEIQRTNREYIENLDSNKLENLQEMHKFLDAYDLPKLSQGDKNHLNRFIINNETEAGTESPSKEKSRARLINCQILPDL
jgi:hypothetical protein